jgi:hypothetical protein
VTVETNLLERMLRFAEPLAREYQARMTDLYGELRRRHSWMSSFFRTRAWNDADVDELVSETLGRYLRDIGATLWVTGGVQTSPLEPLIEDGELIGFTLPIGPLAPAQPIKNIESYTFRNPEAWLRTVARSVLDEYSRKSASARLGAQDINRAVRLLTRQNGRPVRLYGRPRNAETRLVFQSWADEIRKRYIWALTQLPPIQRTAWILCKDELLTQGEAEPLLVPPLHWRAARAALMHRPLPDAEASRLVGRADVSPDASKAKGKLCQLLSDLNPFKASQTLAPRWPLEFLAGPHNQPGSLTFLRLVLAESAEREELAWTTRETDKDVARSMPWPKLQHESGHPPSQERRSMDMVPGWVKVPEPDDPQYVELLKRIRELLKARKKATTIAQILNTTHVPARFGKAWHHTAVSLIARRAGLVQPRPASTASDQTRVELTSPTIVDNRTAEVFHRSEAAGDALFKTPGRSQARNKVSAERTQRGKSMQKVHRNARGPTKAAKATSITARKARKTRRHVQRGKPTQKVRGNSRGPIKAGKATSITAHKARKTIKHVQHSKPTQKARGNPLRPIKTGKATSITARKARKTIKHGQRSNPMQEARRNPRGQNNAGERRPAPRSEPPAHPARS